jgi:hypothetical protein
MCWSSNGFERFLEVSLVAMLKNYGDTVNSNKVTENRQIKSKAIRIIKMIIKSHAAYIRLGNGSQQTCYTLCTSWESNGFARVYPVK